MNQKSRMNYSQIAILLLLQLLSMSINATIFTVTNGTDAGVGSLRQAIIDSNNNTGQDEVNFDIAQGDCDGAGVCHITVLSELPAITDAVIIDGTTQPQYGTAPANVCATNNAASYMRIELNNTSFIDIIILNSSEPSVVKGLSIGGETTNADDAIKFHGNAKHWVNCNHLGVNAEGTGKLKVSTGICISCTSPQGSNGIIGTNSDGVNDVSERNIIAGNRGIYHNSRNNYVIAGNYFALTADGMSGLETSTCLSGRQSSNNIYGSNLDGINDSLERNIFGNCLTGISLSNDNNSTNMIAGNWFGVNSNGTSLANGVNTGINIESITAISSPSYLVSSNWIDSAVDSAITIKEGALLSAGSNNNCITNSSNGLTYSGISLDQPFTDNYWGDISGPSGVGTGTGAAIVYSSTGTISYDPWNAGFQPGCLLDIAPPSVVLTKSAGVIDDIDNSNTISVGDIINYRFTIENTGNA
ncbi:MAG: hypothetical protein JKY19_00960, partial [Alcanivoracaceae bacterium]|nr:hypothetical protein [Alcanivoracaceae bacterium]